MSKKILIIGKNSYLANGISEYFPSASFISHKEIGSSSDLIKNADLILNFSIQPEFSKEILKKEDIIDYQICNTIKDTETKFIFISSRKVYGSNSELNYYSENDELNPMDFYSENKILTEKCLTDLIGDKLTVLRVSNIIGEPIFRNNYNIFMGWISQSMSKNGKLMINKNPYAVKDFITKKYFHSGLKLLSQKQLPGVLNFGSELNIPVIEILSNIVGEENVIIETPTTESDQFLLDCKLLHNLIPPLTKEDLIKQCQENQAIFKTLSKIQVKN